jgi:integrase
MERVKGNPGIYRRGDRYVYSIRVDGKQRWFSERTLDAARRTKQAASTDRDRGEFDAQNRILLREYLEEWLPRYRGTGRRGFREETRYEYGLIIGKHYGWFPPRLKLVEVTPLRVDQFVHHLAKQPGRRGIFLSDSSIRNCLSPLRAAMASAKREGLIKNNPVDGVALPNRARIVDDDYERPRPFPPGTLEVVLDLINPKYRTMFDLLAVTGLRRSELLALEGRHLFLNGERPFVRIRQRVRRMKGEGLVIGPVKSKYSNRDVPIPLETADKLRALKVAHDQLVFATSNGTPFSADNINNRVLGPACSEAGCEWAGMHTFRHHVASRLFAEGRSVVAVQHFLGHHSPAFTLSVYVHLMDDSDIGGPLSLRPNGRSSANGSTEAQAAVLTANNGANMTHTTPPEGE